MQLAGGGSALRTVRLTVDHQRTRAADTFTAIMIEHDRFFAVANKALVEDVDHLEERSLVSDLINVVRLE